MAKQSSTGIGIIVVALFCLFIGDVCHGNGTVPVSGTVTYQGQPVCSMVIANREYVFTCTGDGSFALQVTPDGNGQVKLSVFVSGLDPFSAILDPPQAINYTVILEPLDPDTKALTVAHQVVGGSQSGWARLTGTVSDEGTPLCGLVLANGQMYWTCDDSLGSFDFECPLDSNGQVTIFAFAEEFQPFKAVATPSQQNVTVLPFVPQLLLDE